MEIALKELVKEFGPNRVLDGIDLEIGAGERVALIGPNGSGKTTLIRTLMGMLRADGRVRVGGLEPFDARAALSERVAYVPQIAPNIRVPVEQLIATVCGARELEAEAVVSIARKLGFDAGGHADKAFRRLSGGMKQKLLIALALAAEPQLLLMDEPSASLDADARRIFFGLCAELPAQTTLLLCSHRLEEIRHLIDRVVALQDGVLAADGPLDDFVSQMGRVAIEVRVADRPATDRAATGAVLGERGFEPMAGGRWVGFFDWRDKMPTVRAVMAECGEDIDDLVVNDLRELQVEAASEQAEAPRA